ncbi:MAG: hypothetical protein ACYDGR_16065 [Candidatus Dormibacteria bacterium]
MIPMVAVSDPAVQIALVLLLLVVFAAVMGVLEIRSRRRRASVPPAPAPTQLEPEVAAAPRRVSIPTFESPSPGHEGSAKPSSISTATAAVSATPHDAYEIPFVPRPAATTIARSPTEGEGTAPAPDTSATPPSSRSDSPDQMGIVMPPEVPPSPSGMDPETGLPSF